MRMFCELSKGVILWASGSKLRNVAVILLSIHAKSVQHTCKKSIADATRHLVDH